MNTLKYVIVFLVFLVFQTGCKKYLVSYLVSEKCTTGKVYYKQHKDGEVKIIISSSGLARNAVQLLVEADIENRSSYDLHISLEGVAIRILSKQHDFLATAVMSKGGHYYSKHYGEILIDDSLNSFVVPPGGVEWIRIEGNIIFKKEYNDQGGFGKELIKEIGSIYYNIEELMVNDEIISIQIMLDPVKEILFFKKNLANNCGN